MRISLLIFVLCISHGAIAQTCLPSGIFITNQQEIDAFAFNYSGCTEIIGDVTIEESTPGDITNLNGLSPLMSIGGSLVITNNEALIELVGLENISYIGGDIFISSNLFLSSIASLSLISSVNGNLNVSGNEDLSSLTGLENVTSIGGYIDVLHHNTKNTLPNTNPEAQFTKYVKKYINLLINKRKS